MDYGIRLDELKRTGNFRSIPSDHDMALVDFSSNDYLGLAADDTLQAQFMADEANRRIPFTSSASRLLAARQQEYTLLEQLLATLYGRPALLFNSGYHANTGIVPALASGNDTVILADKLVHASIIDGIRLSGAPFERFRHNDLRHLRRLLEKVYAGYDRVLVIVESVYSMDGDSADLDALTALKREFPGMMLYVDEAHAVGVEGPYGLGLAKGCVDFEAVDLVVGTFGKALASSGAYCVCSSTVHDILVNGARSFIFSTALPPVTCAWTRFVIERMLTMDEARAHLRSLGRRLSEGLRAISSSAGIHSGHIQPFVVGDARKVVHMSEQLRYSGVKVLPIRVPTVPPGTERLRISLSAGMSVEDIDRLVNAISSIQ